MKKLHLLFIALPFFLAGCTSTQDRLISKLLDGKKERKFTIENSEGQVLINPWNGATLTIKRAKNKRFPLDLEVSGDGISQDFKNSKSSVFLFNIVEKQDMYAFIHPFVDNGFKHYIVVEILKEYDKKPNLKYYVNHEVGKKEKERQHISDYHSVKSHDSSEGSGRETDN